MQIPETSLSKKHRMILCKVGFLCFFWIFANCQYGFSETSNMSTIVPLSELTVGSTKDGYITEQESNISSANANFTSTTAEPQYSKPVDTALDHQARLLYKLLNHHGQHQAWIRPVLNYSLPTTVKVRMTFYQIREMQEKEQALMILVWFSFFWTDELLKWDPAEFGGIEEIHLPPEEIWHPDLIIYNSVSDQNVGLDTVPLMPIVAYSSGSLAWYTPTISYISCKVRVDTFPFDIQVCPLRIGSWTYDAKHIDVQCQDPNAVTDDFIKDVQWNLLGIPCVRYATVYPCCPDTEFPLIRFDITLERKPLFIIYNLVLPCVLIMFCGLLVFLMPPESGEKVGLSVTILLAITVFQLMIMENIPPTSDVIPLIAQFFGACVVVLSTITVWAVVVVHFYYQGELGNRPPAWLRKLVFDCLGKILCIKKVQQIKEYAAKQKALLDNERDFILENGITATTHLTEESYRPSRPSETRELIRQMVSEMKEQRAATKEGFEGLKKILQGGRGSRVLKLADMEWRAVAIVLDRFLLYIFLILMILISISLFAEGLLKTSSEENANGEEKSDGN